MFSKSKKILAMSLLSMLLLASCGESKKAEEKPEEKPAEVAVETTGTEKESEKESDAPGEAGFDEFPIDEAVVGPFAISTVYFQAVDMLPAGQNPTAEESDMHVEADIVLVPEYAVKFGFGEAEDVEEGDIWPAYLNIDYQIIDSTGKVVDEGSFMPMNASDGPHYGANIKKGIMTVGSYKLKLEITPSNYLLHVDEETGVPGRDEAEEYFKTQVAEFNWDYTGEQLQNQ